MELFKALHDSLLVYRLGWTLVHILWLGTAVAMALAAALWLLRNRSSQARYLTATVALGLMATLSVATYFTIPAPPAAITEPSAAPVGAQATLISSDDFLVPSTVAPSLSPVTCEPEETPAMSMADVTTPPAIAPQPSMLTSAAAFLELALPYVVLAWCLGVVALSLWHLAGWMLALRLRRMATVVADQNLLALVAGVAKSLRMTRPVRLLESVLVEVPAVIGWLKPAILLPVGFATGLSPQQVEAVLAHEIAHIRRWDYLVNLLQALVETLFFYHPAVWYISRHIRAEREHCCDDLAVGAGAERFGYAELLVQLAGRMGAGALARPRPAAAMMGAVGPASQLRQRIGRLIGLPEGNHAAHPGWLAGIVLFAALATGGIILIGCVGNVAEQPLPPAGEYVEATITVYDSSAGVPPTAHSFTVNSPEDLRELLAHFPQRGRKSAQAGLWISGAVVEIKKSDGQAIRIMLSGNDNLSTWSEGRGDWPVEGDFAAYVKRLRAE